MIDLLSLTFLLATVFFVIAGVYTARSRKFDFTNFGLALTAFGLWLAL